MRSRLISLTIGLIYFALLFKVLVFKDLPTIHLGRLRFEFGGTHDGPYNFIPFTTIWRYLSSGNGLLTFLNVLGNIVLLIPVGFLLPLAFQNFKWLHAVLAALFTGFCFELTQVVLRVGIFDVDDIILNGFGVMMGYWFCAFILRYRRTHWFGYLALAIVLIGCAAVLVSVIYASRNGLWPIRLAGW